MKAAARRVAAEEWWAGTEGMTTMGLLRELKRRGVCAQLYAMIRGGVVLGDESAPILAPANFSFFSLASRDRFRFGLLFWLIWGHTRI